MSEPPPLRAGPYVPAVQVATAINLKQRQSVAADQPALRVVARPGAQCPDDINSTDGKSAIKRGMRRDAGIGRPHLGGAGAECCLQPHAELSIAFDSPAE